MIFSAQVLLVARAYDTSKILAYTLNAGWCLHKSGTHCDPESNTAYLYSGKEGIGRLGVSGSNPLPTFEFQKRILYQMTKPVQAGIILSLLFSILFTGNDNIHSGV